MRLFYIVYFILFTSFNSVKAQTIFPYLEVNNNTDINKITSDSVRITSKFNHFLNSVTYQFYYTNNSDESLDVRFIAPQHHSQNIYNLKAQLANQTIELQAKPIATIRQEIKTLRSKSGYENQEITQNSILIIEGFKSNTQLIITLEFSKIIDTNSIQYSVQIPEQITLRTAEFTATSESSTNSNPKKSISNFIFSGSIPIEKILINNQPPNIKKSSPRNWSITTTSIQKMNIDYEYEAKNINSTIQHFTEGNCDYILGIIQPPKEIKTISPREFIFVIDASGSMKGRPIEEVKKMISSVLKELKSDELFNIVVYGTNQNHFAKNSVHATSDHINSAIDYINNEYGKGGMKLNEAIDFIQQLIPNPNYNRVITIISDGDLDINENLHLAIKSHARSAQFFILGIGHSVNYRAMNFLSLSTGTQPLVINNEYEMLTKIKQFQKQILQPLLRNIQVQSKNINLTETFPKNFNAYLSVSPVHFVTKDCRKVYPKHLEITAKNGHENYAKNFEINQSNTSDFTQAIKFYWVKQKIDFLLKDEDRCGDLCKNDGRYRKEIEKLSIENNLSTPYTILMQSNYQSNFTQDYDTDGDGIADWYDECINDKGTLLSKGCPVNLLVGNSKDVYIQDFSNELIRVVEFNFDESIIRPIDYPILDRIVRIMKSNPHLKFYVEGHTDAMGTSDYNKNLSLNRSKAVVEYFENKGLDKNRFTIIGKGDKELKHTMCRPAEKCEAWKNLQNRRVEFKIKKD